MLKLTLEAIETIDAIARHGSFAGASERLHKVPSTISYAVSKLAEEHLPARQALVALRQRLTATPPGRLRDAVELVIDHAFQIITALRASPQELDALVQFLTEYSAGF